jgi:hypothetical protein
MWKWIAHPLTPPLHPPLHIETTVPIQSLILHFSQTLTTLNLEGNEIGAQGAEHLANVLQQNKVRSFQPLCFPFNH